MSGATGASAHAWPRGAEFLPRLFRTAYLIRNGISAHGAAPRPAARRCRARAAARSVAQTLSEQGLLAARGVRPQHPDDGNLVLDGCVGRRRLAGVPLDGLLDEVLGERRRRGDERPRALLDRVRTYSSESPGRWVTRAESPAWKMTTATWGAASAPAASPSKRITIWRQSHRFSSSRCSGVRAVPHTPTTFWMEIRSRVVDRG